MGAFDVPRVRLLPQDPSPLPSFGYLARATSLVLAGLCEVPWMRRQLVNRSEVRGRKTEGRVDFGVGSESGVLIHDASHGLADLQRQFCSHGMRFLEGLA